MTFWETKTDMVAGDICYIPVHYNFSDVAIHIMVKVLKVSDYRCEVCPVAGDDSCFWAIKDQLVIPRNP